MATTNPFALLYGSDQETFNAQVTNKQPSFLDAGLKADHDDGMYSDVLAALEARVTTAPGKKKAEATDEHDQYKSWMDTKDKLQMQSGDHLAQVQKAAKQVVGSGNGTPLCDKPDLRYRLEALDEKNHRMGDYLEGAYKEFCCVSAHVDKPNFFRWVEDAIKQDGDNAAKRWHPELFKNATPQQTTKYLQWFKEGVKYVKDEQERDRYKVSIDQGEMKRREPKKTGAIEKFDSKQLVDHFKSKQDPVSSCIWVMSPNGTFYSHLSKVGRFHHSSLRGGENVEAAGEWTVCNGKLTEIDGTTGHYKVDANGFVKAIKALDGQNALQADTKVVLYAKDGQKTLIPARDFASDPSKFLQDKSTFNPMRHGQV